MTSLFKGMIYKIILMYTMKRQYKRMSELSIQFTLYVSSKYCYTYACTYEPIATYIIFS